MWLHPPPSLSPLSQPSPPRLSLHQQGRYCSKGKMIVLRDRFSYVLTQTTLTPFLHLPAHTPLSLHLGEAAFIHSFLSVWQKKDSDRKRGAKVVLFDLIWMQRGTEVKEDKVSHTEQDRNVTENTNYSHIKDDLVAWWHVYYLENKETVVTFSVEQIFKL